VDYTFSGVNEDTLPLAALDAMQFGHALECLLHRIVAADPRHGPVYLSKVDLANGFYCIWLRLQDILKLGVTIPSLPGEGPLVALPLALPMGWCNSPPIFCTATETMADVANQRLLPHTWYGAHPLEAVAMTPPDGLPYTGTPPASHPSTALPPTHPTNPTTGPR